MTTNQRPMSSYVSWQDLRAIAQSWWLLLLRGIVTILFGLAALAWPGLTILTLALLYGVFAMIEGGLSIAAAATGRGAHGPTWWLLLAGVLGLAVGLLTIFWPGITALTLVIFFGAWALCKGIVEIVGAISLRKEIENEWHLIGAGILSVIVGFWILLAPGAGILALSFLIGFYALLAGALMVAFSLRLRKLGAPQ